jgi:hypothetical protein
MGKPTAATAKHGEKMIEVRLRFWTNDIAPVKGEILPKNAWTNGWAYMVTNASHGISPSKPVPFHSLMEISEAVRKALVDNGVLLHPSIADAKLFKSNPKKPA